MNKAKEAGMVLKERKIKYLILTIYEDSWHGVKLKIITQTIKTFLFDLFLP